MRPPKERLSRPTCASNCWTEKGFTGCVDVSTNADPGTDPPVRPRTKIWSVVRKAMLLATATVIELISPGYGDVCSMCDRRNVASSTLSGRLPALDTSTA
eukprot:3929656-Rhodomonas_salina.2